MELVELVRGAQEAMDRGDYHLAARACTHALETYPSCVSAHRILGEALLERGETEPAIDHFDRTLALDPLNVVARLGLGVAAEERKDPGLAYAHYLHAWEINPALDQVRDQLVRLRAALGSQDRLHPTRAGLAGIHARSGQLGRAASEWRAILAADPESIRARTALAEVLWRAGDDAAAVAICREIVRGAPENARVLAILADVEYRQGAVSAGEWIERYRAVDPIGEVAAYLGEVRGDADLSYLAAVSLEVPDFDLTASLDAQPDTAATAAATASALSATHVAAPDLWDTIVRDLNYDGAGATGVEDAGIQPFIWTDDGSADAVSGAEPFSLAGLQELEEFAPEPVIPTLTPAAPAPTKAAMPEDAALGIVAAEPALELAATMPPEPAVAPPPVPASLPISAPLPVSVPAAPDPFVAADGRVDLTAGWDDLDRALKAATPDESAGNGYEALLAELDAGGVAPFAAEDEALDNGAWEPFSADEFGEVAPAVAASPDAVAEVPALDLSDNVTDVALTAPAAADKASLDLPWASSDEAAIPADWVDIDEDLIAAIPSQQPSGYTDLLRHIDQEELQAFPEPDAAALDPFATPDTAGEPIDFEDLLSVTSRDGTAPLGLVASAPAPPVAEAGELGVAAFEWSDVEPAAPAAAHDLGFVVDDLGGVEPFRFDEADMTDATGEDDELPELEDLIDVFGAAPETADAHLAAHALEVSAEPPGHEEAPLDQLAVAIEVDPPTVVAPAQPESLGEERVSAWPTFVGHASSAVEGAWPAGGLFDRLRIAKQALIDDGKLVVDRSVVGHRVAVSQASDDEFEAPAVLARPVLAAVDGEPLPLRQVESNGFDLTAMRVQLIESESAATTIAATLEAAIAQGYPDPLALRVLGEAYLRLGRTEQAAAQFRQAMLARRRAR